MQRVAEAAVGYTLRSRPYLDHFFFIGDGDDYEDASVDCLMIMGGEGVYWVGLTAGKYDQLRLFDATKELTRCVRTNAVLS